MRGDGALTTADRDYLDGELDLAVQSVRQKRQRIRDRLRASLFDFSAATNQLPQSDQNGVFAHDVSGPSLDQAMIDALSFLYTGTIVRHGDDSDDATGGEAGTETFESVVESAVNASLEQRGYTDYAATVDVDVEKVPPRGDIGDLGKQPARVLKVLLERGEITKDEFINAVA